MVKLPVYNQLGEKTAEEIELPSKIFALPKIKPQVVHSVVVAALSNCRRPIASTKTRGEVRGGGKKPWQQKGTGRARAGSIRSPLWKGGGIIFGPRPDRNFYKKINRKVRRLGLFSVLSDKAKNNQIVILDNLETTGKTKDFISRLNKLREKFANLGKGVLIILASKDEKLLRSARNLQEVGICLAYNLNILELLKSNGLIILKDALPVIEKTYLKAVSNK